MFILEYSYAVSRSFHFQHQCFKFRLKPNLKFIHWNTEGWKTGLCSVPPVGQSYSLLTLANNTCIHNTFVDLRDRFNRLYKRKVHACRKTPIDQIQLRPSRLVLRVLVILVYIGLIVNDWLLLYAVSAYSIHVNIANNENKLLQYSSNQVGWIIFHNYFLYYEKIVSQSIMIVNACKSPIP